MKPSTLAIHAGSRLSSRARPLAPAIHVSAVSSFDDADALDQALDGKDFTYGRISAQNATLLEEAIAALEGAEDCASYASGMAALKAVFEAQGLKRGDRVVIASDGYGVTRALFKRLCQERELDLVALPLADADAPAQVQKAGARLVVAESMTNPRLSVPDLPALARATHAAGGVLAVDGTFSSPALQCTLAQGADYAVQSTTKWLNGHSDAVGGTVSGSRARIAPLKSARILDGAILGPFEAWLTLRGVRTLFVRMKAHSENAMRVAQRLTGAPGIERVLYPGLTDHPQHAIAQRLLIGGHGGMLAFEIKGATRAQGFAFLEAVRLCQPAPSLGDVTTLVMHAASASARRMTPGERAAAGIGENLIRVSVGLEDPDDISSDILEAVSQALRRR
jgi:cystathionine gamma-synthase